MELDYYRLRDTRKWTDFEIGVCEIQRINLSGMSPDEQCVFWIHCYNLLALHSSVFNKGLVSGGWKGKLQFIFVYACANSQIFLTFAIRWLLYRFVLLDPRVSNFAVSNSFGNSAAKRQIQSTDSGAICTGRVFESVSVFEYGPTCLVCSVWMLSRQSFTQIKSKVSVLMMFAFVSNHNY
jgi:hypothetical protein